MSFLPAVQREINNRRADDRVRLTLDYMMHHAVGRNNAVPLPKIVAHLKKAGANISENGFQQTVLAASRDGDYFIGSGRHGYFLIDTIDDAREMQDFYETRIRAEQQNLDNLRRQAEHLGWKI